MSGYDYTFACEVPKDYSCPICECPMREPVQTKCGHRFCKECLQKSLKRKKKCPIDRGPLNERSPTDIYPDVAVERAILDLRVQCPNESNGCKWTGELRIVKTHEATCDFIGVKCSNKGCKVTPLKMDLLRHVTNECSKREVQCSYCNTPFVWCQRQGHFEVCKKFPMSCLQNCGEQKIPRDKMNDHIEESCPLTKVDCTFAHIGCKVKVQRRAIADHVKRNTENHLKLACEKLQEFQVLSTVNTAHVKELEAEMVTAKKKITELSEAVMENSGLQELLDKLALADKKLNELPEKNEVNSLLKEVKELKDEKLLKLQNTVNELQKLVPKNNRLKVLQGEVTGCKMKLDKLETATSELREQGQSDRKEISDLSSQNLEIRRELRDLRDETQNDRSLLQRVRDQLSAHQDPWGKILIFVYCVILIVGNLPNKVTVAQLQEELGVLEQKCLAWSTDHTAYLGGGSGKVHFVQDKSICRANKFIWSISEFDLRFRKAKTDSSKPCFSSEPFFSEPYGYRMSISVCPNGAGTSRNSHLSIFFNLLSSNNDAFLHWPFQQKVVFTLIDQQEDPSQVKHVANEMSLKKMPHLPHSCYAGKGKGFGVLDFVSHKKLKSRKYIQNNTVLVQLEVYPLDCQ